MECVNLSLNSRSYKIFIGKDIIKNISNLIEGNHAFLFVDKNVSEYGIEIQSQLEESNWKTHLFEIEATESFKDFSNIYPLFGELLAKGANRQSVIFAIGGGVIGDSIGFLASTYMRGIRWVGVPTTLLAQVDSSIGGKTGVNHDKGKNLVGAFHQPSLVICDTNVLNSLPDREIIAGLGEIIKYGLIDKVELYRSIQSNWDKLIDLDSSILVPIIRHCVEFKSRCVEQDERDLSGIREVLNFGHTMGHALETVSKYDYFKHGEAVIWGMRFALYLSAIKKHISFEVVNSIDEFLKSIPIPEIPNDISIDTVIDAIKFDKKAESKGVRFVLLSDIGKWVSDLSVKREDILTAYQLMNECHTM